MEMMHKKIKGVLVLFEGASLSVTDDVLVPRNSALIASLHFFPFVKQRPTLTVRLGRVQSAA